MEKDQVPVEVEVEEQTSQYEVPLKWKGTEVDQHDMLIIGRRQELRRNFQLISILGFGCNLICTWEINLTTFGISFTNGGTAGMIYVFIIAATAYTFIYLSLAEMASMAPTAGGQYHWVSEFAPSSCQKYLSYMSGWLCFTGWQAAIGSVAFIVGLTMQSLIILHAPDTYDPKPWHGTLFVIALILASFFFNTILAKKLPLVEGLVFLIHIIGPFAIAIPLWTLATRKTAHAVFTEFENYGGWPTQGLSAMVGMISITGSLGGIDCVVHMAEEVKDASRTLPRTITTAIFANASLGFFIIVTICFCTPDVDAALSSPVGLAGYPFLQTFQDATGSLAATTIMAVIPMFSLTGSVVASIATASRQLWSFARDGGVPFSRYVAKVNPRWAIPLNAILVSLIFNCLLPLINIGSSAAINAIFSLSGVSILTSYGLCIGSVLLKRIRGEPLPSRRWSLGRWGMPINIIALCWLIPLAVFQFFPSAIPVTPKNMNWGCLMFGTMIIASTMYYVLHGRKVYTPPVVRVRRDLELQ